MLRIVEGHTNKALSVMYTASAALKRGAFVTPNEADMTVGPATGATQYLVDVSPNYDGINAAIEPTDGAFEDIKEGDRVILVPVLIGEKYATSEVTKGSLNAGDKIAATAGKAAANASGDWVYCGEYSDPTGIPMYVVKRVVVEAGAGG